MALTTVKVSVETRERLRELGGERYEETIVEALDALEVDRFWVRAEAAAATRRSLSSADRKALAAREAEVGAAFDGIG